jgi:hypothetical protein
MNWHHPPRGDWVGEILCLARSMVAESMNPVTICIIFMTYQGKDESDFSGDEGNRYGCLNWIDFLGCRCCIKSKQSRQTITIADGD